MLAIGGFLLGAGLGALRARRLGGKAADLAQYAMGFGLILAVIGLFVQIFLMRSGV